MERFAAWYWRRFRRHYGAALAGLTMVAVGGGIQAPVILVMNLWFDISLGDALRLWLVLLTALALGLAFGIFTNPHARRVVAWGRGHHADPVQARDAALCVAPTSAIRGGAVVVVLDLAVAVPVLSRSAEIHSWAIGGIMLGTVVSTFAAGMVIAVGFQLLMRPLLEEVADLLPAGSPAPTRLWGLRSRLQGGVAAACFLAATASGGAGALADTAQERFAIVTVSACVITGYLSLLFSWGLIEPALDPLRDLARAVDRVRRGDYTERLVVTTPDELGDLVFAFNDMQQGLREREALHAAFGSYVDPALAQRLIESGSSMFEGEDLDVSVLFADVRNFTSYSEGVEPAEAVALLNQLFDVVVPVLHDHGGHANRYLGDGLLAVFGAPNPLEHHADAAVTAAVEIQQRVRAEFGKHLRLGVGINTGPVIAGTVGGGGRLEFTVIGDTVNAASRVEALTKETGDAILITEATRLALSTPRPRSIKRGEFEVRGKATKLILHAINPFPRAAK